MNNIKNMSLVLAVAVIAVIGCVSIYDDDADATSQSFGTVTYNSIDGFAVHLDTYTGGRIALVYSGVTYNGAVDSSGNAICLPGETTLPLGTVELTTRYLAEGSSKPIQIGSTELTIAEVVFDSNNGSDETESVRYSLDSFALPDFDWEGPNGEGFLGWATTATATEPDVNSNSYSIPSDGITLYAVYGDAPITEDVTVTFDSNGGSEVPPMPAAPGEYIDLPEPSREGYTFSGWYDNEELTGDPVNVHYQVNGDITLYAKWSANPTGYRVDDSQVKKDGYVAGDELDLSDLKVYQTFSDKSEVEVDFTTDPEDGTVLEEGTQTVTVYVDGEVVGTFQVNVSEAPVVPTGYRVDDSQVKKDGYVAGDELDLSDLKVYQTFSDKSEVEVDFTTDPEDGTVLEEGTHTVTVYVGDVSVGSFDIIVGAAVVESIEVTTPPTNTVYTVGEALDLSGLVVIAKYSDGTTSIVTGYITDPVAGAILNTAGSSQAVTVTYEGKTASFAITVNPDETTVGPIITVDTNLGGKVVSSGSVDNGDGTYTVTVVVAPTTGFTVYNVYVSNGYTYETEGMPEDISDIVTAGNVTITIYGVTDSVDVDVTFVPLILDDDDDNPTNPPVVVDPKEDDNSVVIVAIAAGVVVAILAALILMHTRKN